MIAGIFIVPLIYLFNSFFIGRLIKKWKININPFLCSLLGFAIFFDLIYIFSIWLYGLTAPIWSYYLAFSLLQGLLLSLYIANWKFAFITFNFDLRKFAYFVAIFSISILISWANFRTFKSGFATTWLEAIKHTQVDIWKPILFTGNNDDLITSFSAFNVANQIALNLFKIKSSNNIINFLNWIWTIIGAFFIATMATWVVTKKTSLNRLIITGAIFLIFEVVVLAFIESFAIGDSWILLLLLFYILLIPRYEESHTIKLISLTSVLMCFLAASCTSFFVVIAVWIFSIYYVIKYKLNSLNYFLFLSWPLFLTIFSFLSFFTSWLLVFFNSLYLIVAIATIVVFIRFGTPVWDTKIATIIHNNAYKIIYTGLFVFISIILISNFFIFQEVYKWNFGEINYRNFLTFTYSYVWSIKITSATGIATTNALMYTVFVALTIVYIVIRCLKKHKLNYFFKTNSVIKFGIISCMLFINPLVIHVLNVSDFNFPLNTLDLNALFVIPIFVIGLQASHNLKLKRINDWNFNWY